MKRFRRLSIIIFIVLMQLGILGACSNKETTTDVSQKGTVKNPTQLTFAQWGTAAEVEATKKLLDKFMSENPTIKVKLVYKDWGSYWTWLTAQAASKDLPDVYKIDSAYVDKYAKLGAMKPLDTDIKKYQFDTSNFEKAVLDLHKVGGQQVSLPRDANTIVFYFNKDLFDKAKVPYPTDNMTWDQILPLAQKLTLDKNGKNATDPNFDSNNIVQYGLIVDPAGTADSVLEPQLWSNGAKLVDDNQKLVLNTPDAKQVLQYFRDLTVKYHVNPTSSHMKSVGGDPFLAIGTGKIAMSFGGSWSAYEIAKSAIHFDVVLPPMFKTPATVVQPAGYAMSNYTKKDAAAFKLLSWLVGPEGQKEMAKQGEGIPANKQAVSTYLQHKESFNSKVFLDAQKSAIPAPFFDGKDKLVWEYIPQKLQLPLSGKGNMDKALNDLKSLYGK